MKLESELKNSKPLAPHARALLNILFTASWLDCQQTRQMRNYGLTPPQYNILRILNGSAPKGLSVLDIKSRMIDRSSNVSRLVEKLRAAALVEHIPSHEDRRMVIVTLSEKAKHLLAEIEKSEIFTSQMPGKALTEAEAMELAHLLDKFRE